jgi:hypothetical protein
MIGFAYAFRNAVSRRTFKLPFPDCDAVLDVRLVQRNYRGLSANSAAFDQNAVQTLDHI